MFNIVVFTPGHTRESLEKIDAKIRQAIKENISGSTREEILISFPAMIFSNGISISISRTEYFKSGEKRKLSEDLLQAVRIFFPLPTPVFIDFGQKRYSMTSEVHKSGIMVMEI